MFFCCCRQDGLKAVTEVACNLVINTHNWKTDLQGSLENLSPLLVVALGPMVVVDLHSVTQSPTCYFNQEHSCQLTQKNRIAEGHLGISVWSRNTVSSKPPLKQQQQTGQSWRCGL